MVNVVGSCSSDNDDNVGSDDNDDDFGGGVDDEVFPSDADVPDSIEPMGMENITQNINKFNNANWQK